MIIYAEIVFLSNFFIDAFIYVLTLTVLKSRIRKARIIIASVIGGLMSAVLPIIPQYAVAIKIFCIVLLPAIFHKAKRLKEYLCVLCVFLTITMVLGGAAYMLKSILGCAGGLYLEYGVFPIIFSLSGICIIGLSDCLRKYYFSIRAKNRNLFDVEITVAESNLRIMAYFDSGNRVYANNGEPVTVVAPTVYNMFSGDEEDVAVNTISGVSLLKARDAKIKIYFDDGDNKIYSTKIAAAPFLKGDYQVILHSDMYGG